MRYKVVFMCGRYELRDNFTDHVVCFSYTSENANIICQAMNELYEKDKENINV